LCFLCEHKDSLQRIFIHKYFLITVGSGCHVKRFIPGSRNVAKFLLMTKMVKEGAQVAETTVKQKTSKLRFSTHWERDGISVSMLVEDMSKNKCFFQVPISHVFRFISICDLIIDIAS
jgi:hypothetical protein